MNVSVGVGVSVDVAVSVGALVGTEVSVGAKVFVDVSVGTGVAQALGPDWVFRGLGEPAVKSLLLLSESVQPFDLRKSTVVLLGAGARPAPSKQSAVVP